MKLNELLGTEFPLIQGGMANIATGAFAAACSNAGALGIVASGGMDAPALREQIRAARALTDKPFGVNLMLMNPHIDELAQVVIEEHVSVLTTGAGVSGLLSTAAICTGRSEIEIAEEIGMGGSGQLKKYVTEAVNNYFEPIRERRHRFENDLDYVKDVLAEGNRRANEIAKATLAEVAEAMGMVY